MAKLNLKIPVVFFDLETTGVDVSKDKIVEISWVKIYPNGKEEEKSMRINPGCHIPEGASEVHHIYDEDVKDKPLFKEVAAEIAKVFEGSDIAGFNSNRFDIPLLVEEFLRAGVDIDLRKHRFIDVQNIYHKLERRTLVAAYKKFCGKDLENAHSALADTRATYEVLEAQLDFYPDQLENDMDMLADFSTMTQNVDFAGRMAYNDKNQEIFTFGKYKGMLVTDVLRRDPGYFNWILQGDFTLDTKRELKKIRLRESVR